MDGEIRGIVEHLQKVRRVNIPVYQRNYAWNINNCDQLFNDLMLIVQRMNLNDSKSLDHFFGLVVVESSGKSEEEYVIDGQQRITTVSLLFLAIKKRLNCSAIKSVLTIDNTDELKLKLNPDDSRVYQSLFNSDKLGISESNIAQNFEFFKSKIKGFNDQELKDLMEALNHLKIMLVNIGYGEDPQKIFESLNSTGVNLTEGDKIRNFILMNERMDEQQKCFKDFWQPIEQNVHGQTTDFFKCYLTFNLTKAPTSKNLYWSFVSYYNSYIDGQNEIENTDLRYQLLEQLKGYSIAYKYILNANTGNNQIDEILYRISKLNKSVVNSFLMPLFYDYDKQRVNSEEIINILITIETYLARLSIMSAPTNSLNKIFGSMYREMMRLKKNSDDDFSLSEIVNYILLNKQGTGRFPTNDEIKERFKNGDFYHINSAFRTYLFERLENQDNVEKVSIYDEIETKKYSVEHIMPQHLNQSWIDELGSDNEQIHDKYLHNIGNLTLTGYNSQYSNRSFKEKQTMEKGFKESHFRNLNALPAKADQWNEYQIVQRMNQLTNIALQIWPQITSDFQPSKSTKFNELIFTGTENQEFFKQIKGTKIRAYKFNNDDMVNVKTWIEMYLQIIQNLLDVDSTLIKNYAEFPRDNKEHIEYCYSLFTTNPNQFNESFKLSNNLYTTTRLDNWCKFRSLEVLFDSYDIPYENLRIYLRN